MSAQNARPDYTLDEYELPLDQAVELGKGHHMLGNFIIAERTYHDILKTHPDNATVNHLLGALYYQTGDIDRSLQYMKTSIDLDPDQEQYWGNYGGVLSAAEKYDEAIICLRKALEITPDNAENLNRKSLAEWKHDLNEEAEISARKSLDIAKDNLDGYINLGISLARQNKFKEAISIWKKSGEIYPNEPRIWSNLANMLRETNQLHKALEVARKAVSLDDQDIESLNNLGCILKDLGQADEAIELFREATNISPRFYQAHYNMSLAYSQTGKHKEAAIAARYAVDFKEDFTPAHNALSAALAELGEFSQSHYSAQRAVQLDSNNAEAYIALANILNLSDRFDDGFAALSQALKLNPDSAEAYKKLSMTYERLDEYDLALEAINKAIEMCPEAPYYVMRKGSLLYVSNNMDEAIETINKAIEMAPHMLDSYLIKAEIYTSLNQLDEAEKAARAAQDIDPDYPPIYSTISSLKTFESENDPDFVKMLEQEEIVQKMGLHYVASLCYAIARSYEKLKNYDKAFIYYNKASVARRKIIPYNRERAGDMFTQTKAEFTAEVFEKYKGLGHDSDEPIFIVGMPRSGTTLTEQILSAHPKVFGAGELNDVGRARKKIGALSEETIKELGELYIEYAHEKQKEDKLPHFTDKMPGNFLFLGLIAAMLPNAKIIHCTRNPMDTALSNYKQEFMAGQSWSYDLEELAEEYLRYQDLMAHWHKVLPGRVLDINYEDTVNDLEGQARKLIDFCGLEWDDACAMPHKQERAVLTASKMQVTKPVYKSSVEKWKRYEKQMQPFVRIVAPDQALPEEN